jgi:hypothetical protein
MRLISQYTTRIPASMPESTCQPVRPLAKRLAANT